MHALDVLRGAAVILVLLWHWPGQSKGMGPVGVVNRVGWTGVDLFFVLSGFLISGLLFKEWDRSGSVDLRRFWLRRGFKIWPAYFAAFGLVMALRAVPRLRRPGGAHEVVAELRQYLPSALFVQNYFSESRHWKYTWSVAVEEHFYLALPLLLLVLARRHRQPAGAPDDKVVDRALPAAPPFPMLPLVGLLLCTGVLAMRLMAARAGASWREVYYPTHLRADSLFFGVLLGYFHRYFRPAFERACRPWPLLLLAAPAALVVPALFPFPSAVTYSVGLTLLYLGYGALVALAAVYPNAGASIAPARWAAAAGRYSYTIYLAHGAMQLLPRYGRSMAAAGRLGGMWAQRALFVGLALAGGVALAWFVERPALRLRERWLPGPRLTGRGGSGEAVSPSAPPA